MSSNLLTVNEVAKVLKVTRATVYDLMKKGEISYIMVGQRRRVEASEVESYLQRNKRKDGTGSSGSDNGRVSPCVATG